MLLRHRAVAVIVPLMLALSSCLFDSDDGGDEIGIPSDTLAYRELAVSPRHSPFDVPTAGSMQFRFAATPGASYRVEVQTTGSWQAPFWLHYEHGGNAVLTDRYSTTSMISIDIVTPAGGICFFRLTSKAQFPVPIRVRVVPLRAGVPIDSFEADDRHSEADRYTITEKISQDRTMSGSDTDWVRFDVDSGWHYAINAFWTAYPHAKLLRTELLGPDLEPIAVQNAIGNQDPPIYVRCYRSGVYSLRITDSGSEGGRRMPDFGSYRLVIEGAAIPDSDDTPAEAMVTPADGSSLRDRIRAADDVDWFRFQADSGQKYLIEATGDSFRAVIAFKLDRDQPWLGPELVAAAEHVADTARIEWVCRSSGSHSLNVQAASLGPQRTGLYALRVRKVDRTSKYDFYEPDDAPDEAKPIPTDGILHEHTLHGADIDYIAFDADSGAVYAIRPAGLDWLDWIWPNVLADSAGNMVDGGTYGWNGQKEQLEFHCPRTGRYLVHITAPGEPRLAPSTTPATPYRLSIQAIPRETSAVDSFEPDDTPAAAREIATDGTPQARAVLGSNIDWIRFRPDSGKTYEITMRREGAFLGASLLYFPDGPSDPLYQSSISLGEPVLDSTSTPHFIWTCSRSFANVWSQSAFLSVGSGSPGNYAFAYTLFIREIVVPEPQVSADSTPGARPTP